MLNYSIHTYELYAEVNYYEASIIYNRLMELNASIQPYHDSNNKHKIQMLSYTFRKLPYSAINSLKLTRIKGHNGILKHHLYIILNPYNALHSTNGSDENIINNLQIETALHIIKNTLMQLLPPYIYQRLSLFRVDFCVNVKFKTQLQAEEYISLLRLGIPPKALHEHLTLDKTQHRYVPYSDTLLLECNSYSFQIYSKYRQMHLTNLRQSHIDAAVGIVRFELRAEKNKITQLQSKYKDLLSGNSYTTFLCAAPYIAKQEITDLLSKMVGRKDFHSFAHTISEIEHSNLKDTSLMIDITKYFLRKKYCPDLLEHFNLTHDKWKKILKKYNEIDCSPISVPPSFSLSTYPGIDSWEEYFSHEHD